MTHFEVSTWAEVKRVIQEGAECFFVDEGDFWNIWVREPAITLILLKSEAFRAVSPAVAQYFNLEATQDFEMNFKDRMNQAGEN